MQGPSIGKLHAGGAGKRERRLTYFSAQPLRFFEAFDYQSSDFKARLRRYEGSIKALSRFYSGLTYFSAQPLRFFEAFDYQSSDLKFVAKPPALLPASPHLNKKIQALLWRYQAIGALLRRY